MLFFIFIYVDLGLAEHLDFILTSEECKVEKPDRAIFEIALERAKCSNPSAAFHIGTSLDTDVSTDSFACAILVIYFVSCIELDICSLILYHQFFLFFNFLY